MSGRFSIVLTGVGGSLQPVVARLGMMGFDGHVTEGVPGSGVVTLTEWRANPVLTVLRDPGGMAARNLGQALRTICEDGAQIQVTVSVTESETPPPAREATVTGLVELLPTWLAEGDDLLVSIVSAVPVNQTR